MKRRFSAREFALLCAPVAVIAGVGWFASRRPVPVAVPLHLEFRVAKPTVLEAFQGANSVFETRIVGDDAAQVEMSFTDASVEINGAKGKEIISSSGYSTASP